MRCLKRIALAFLCIIVFVCSAVVFVACGKDSGKNAEVLISGFESYDEVTSFRWTNTFGRADLVNDKAEALTQGEYCLRLQPEGDVSDDADERPSFMVFTESKWSDKYDYSDVSEFKVDVYNDMASDVKMYFSFETKLGAVSSTTEIVLKPGENEVVLNFERGFLVQLIDIGNIAGFWFAFDETETASTIYIDNFRALVTSEPIPEDVEVRKPDELESADRAEYLSAWQLSDQKFSPCELTFNEDPKFIKGGKGSFKFTTKQTGGTTWPSLMLINTAITDLSDYYSISLWVYNDNDIDYQFRMFSNVQVRWAKAKQWTLFEFTIDELKTIIDKDLYDPSISEEDQIYKYDVENFANFNLGLTCPNQELTFYFDEFYANKDNKSAPTFSFGQYQTICEPNVAYTIPVPEVVNGTAEWQVYAPDGSVFGEENVASFTPTQKGEYVIRYIASNDYAQAEYEITVAVGYLPVFELDFYNKSVSPGTYTIQSPESGKNGGTITWKAWKVQHLLYYPNGEDVLLADNAASVELADGELLKIVFTAENDDGTYTQTQYIKCSAGKDLGTIDEEFYKKGLDGFIVNSDKRFIFSGDYGLKLVGNGTVSGIFGPGTYLNGEQTSFEFMVYNNSSESVTLVTGNSEGYAIPANSWRAVTLPASWYSDWGCFTANRLTGLNVTATGASIELYFSLFTITYNDGGPNISAPENSVWTGEIGEEYSVPEAAAEDGSVVSWQVYDPFGDAVGEKNAASFVPAVGGEFTVVYSATNIYGTKTWSHGIMINADLPELNLTDHNVLVEKAGDYTIVPPEGTNYETLTWKVYEVAHDYAPVSPNPGPVLIADNSPKTVSMIDRKLIRIDYTAVNSDGSVTVSQYVLCDEGQRFEEAYGDIYKAEYLQGLSVNTDERYILSGTQSLKLEGLDVAYYKPGFDLGDAYADGEYAFRFMVYNAGEEDITVYVGQSGGYVLPAGVWREVAFQANWYKNWGCLDEEYRLTNLNISIVGESPVMYIDLFTLFEPLREEEPAEGTLPELNLTDHNVLVEKAGDYTIVPPEGTNYETLTWKVYSLAHDFAPASPNPAPVLIADNSPSVIGISKDQLLRIDFTMSNQYGEVTVSQFVKCDENQHFNELYDDIYNLAYLKDLTVNTDERYVLCGNQSLHMQGTGGVNAIYAPGFVFPENITEYGFYFMVYNAGETTVKLQVGLAGLVEVPPREWRKVNYPLSWLKNWDCVDDETNALVKLNLDSQAIDNEGNPDPEGAVDIYFDMFTIVTE